MQVLMLAGILGMAAASPTMAAAGQFYAGAEVGQSKATDGCNGTPAGVSCKDTDTAYRIAGGYQFTPNLGLEVGYMDLGKVTMGGTYIGIPFTGDWKASGFDVVLVGLIPVGGDFSVFGKAGFAQTEVKLSVGVPGSGSTDQTATSTTGRFGVGLQYDFTKSLAGRVQYDNYGKLGDDNKTGTAKMSVFSAGLVVSF
jgi:OOP family OmpA-OmpF porin